MRDNRAAVDAVSRAIAAKGLSREGFAQAAGISPNTLRTFLNGQRWPNMATLGKVEAMLQWPAGRVEDIALGHETGGPQPTDAEVSPENPSDPRQSGRAPIDVWVKGTRMVVWPDPNFTDEQIQAMAPEMLAAAMKIIAKAIESGGEDGVTS